MSFESRDKLAKVCITRDNEQARLGCLTPVGTQVASLKALAPGWFDGEGPGYESDKLDWFSKLLVELLDKFQLPRPFIYPTREGFVRVEWSGVEWEVSSIFDLNTRGADVVAVRVDVDSERHYELAMPLTEPGAETKLGRFLHDHLSARPSPSESKP